MPVSRRELIRKLRRLGFEGPFSGKKHEYMRKGNIRIIIPNPHGRDIGTVLLRQILKQAGISIEEWLKA
ncbi:MAG: hypothetical protein SLRJCFUN_001739 [Candidatus Fervidibacter sp.]